MNDLFESNVITSAKAETLRKARGKGCDCPVCGQFVKVYRRLINSAMAMQLAWAYKQFGVGKIFHIKDILEGDGGGADFAKLRYWGLIAEIENNNPKKKKSGQWYVTTQGEYFIKGNNRLFKYALIYDGKFLVFDGDESVSFRDCLGKNFDYQELMTA